MIPVKHRHINSDVPGVPDIIILQSIIIKWAGSQNVPVVPLWDILNKFSA